MIAVTFGGTARFIWSRHRKVLLGGGAIYVAIFIACQVWSPDLVFRRLPPTMAFLRLAPFFLPLFALIGGTSGGREGSFPRLFYTLPIKAYEMVMPFITYCTLLAAAQWLVGVMISDWRLLKLGPPGTPIETETISYWIAFLSTSALLWLLAVVWTPFPRRFLKSCAVLAVIVAHSAALVLHVLGAVTSGEVIVASVLQIPLTFLVAARGVARDRSGPEIAGLVRTNDKAAATGLAANAAARPPLRSFAHAMDAQLWFEHRVHRWNGMAIYSVPVALVLVLGAFDIAGMGASAFGVLARITLMTSLWALVSMGASNGLLFSSFRVAAHWSRKEAFTMPPFFAALPLSTGDFVWAKLISVTRKMLWFTVGVLFAMAWVASRAGFIGFAHGPLFSLGEQHGDLAAVTLLAIPLIAATLLLLSATASLMCLSLAGRAWSWLNGANAARYAVAAVGMSLTGAYWGAHHVPPPGLSQILVVFAVAKLATLIVLVRHVARSRLLDRGRLAIILGAWFATFAALLTTAFAFLPEGQISLPTLVAFLVLLSPVLGTVAAPLALHLNRVR